MPMYAIAILVQYILIQIDAEWLQIDRSFTNKQITNNNWLMNQCCDDSNFIQLNKQSCSTNSHEYIQLIENKQQIRKQFNYTHFKVQIIYDYFADYSSDSNNELFIRYRNNSVQEWLDYVEYDDDDLYHFSNRICNTNPDYRFRYYTNVSNVVENNGTQFNVTFCLKIGSSSAKIGIRNLLVYVNTCYPTCLTCDGEDFDDCNRCYDGISRSNGQCTCKSDQQFAQTSIGCRQECDRNYYIARSDKICVPDRRITSNLTYFDSNTLPSNNPFYLPFLFIEDQLHPLSSNQLQYYQCNSRNFFGKFKYNEAISLQLNFNQPVRFIRIRLTFYFYQIQQNSQIKLFLDDQIYSKISKTSSSGYSFDNFIKIYQYDENTNCNGSYTRIRVETVLNIPNSQTLLKIQGVFQQNSEIWGFNNFTIDQGVCKENCKICKDFHICQECISGYNLYKNGCVLSCPVHSSGCIDYEDMIPYSRYVAKGFYDFNMTYDEISSFYNQYGSGSGSGSGSSWPNFRSGQRFSFFPDKIVLGGMLVWTDYAYKKNWYIYQPHYAVTFRFNITFGDNYPGKFYYKIDSTEYGPVINPGGGQNILGKSDSEATLYIEKQQNFNGFNLSIELECNHTSSIDFRDSFCAISEYFLVVHNCQPLCLSCTSATTCSSWKDGRNTCQDGKYLYYDTTSFNYTCESCTQPGCIKCTSVETCTQCKDDTQILQNDICQCLQNLFRFDDTCIQCDMQCLTCYGIGQNNCITCNKKHHRIYFESQCICEPGYYDNGEQVECQTYFCGDKIIQPGEQCDDGNLYPFDGCYKCKLVCDQYCDICVNGWCYKCLKGYELSSDNSCQPICHDNIIAVPEQCDNNQQNCLNCQFKCTDYCTQCEFGICKLCNEQKGYYLQQDGSCQAKCGDKIIARSEQCDDGNLLIDDGCINCIQTCDSNCQICMKSKCQICKEGFIEIGGKCFSQCNNHIQTATEVCEDNNETPYDGCFFCQYSCSIICIDCKFGKCFKCDEKKGWYLQKDGSCKPLCGDLQLAILTEFCDDNNSYPYDGCNQCMLSCDEYCDICYQGLCTLCKKGYQLDFNTNSCYLKCDISYYLDVYENCNKLNKNCQQCKFKCKDPCTKCEQDLCLECKKPGWYYNSVNKNCEPKCGDGIIINGFEQCEDSLDRSCNECKYTCQEQCNFCVQGRCFSCIKGWILNLDQICTVVHGDNLSNNLIEQCDDYNSLPYDGCYQGKFSCQSFCLTCKRGICQLCSIGYYLQDGFCKEIHNDGIIVYQEQCDDNNLVALDGCHSGKFDCPVNCLLCVYGQCLQCKISSGYGYLDDYQNKCKSICGDRIVTADEECDDGNNIQYDGCYQCKFQCQQFCIKCLKGFCSQCFNGYYLSDGFCKEIYNDGLVVSQEVCDDNNLISQDSCHFGRYDCPQNCQVCVNGKCFKCNNTSGYGYLDEYQNTCKSICGDHIQASDEECEDGNLNPDDGCFQCKFKCQQSCIKCQRGICFECKFGYYLQDGFCKEIYNDGIIVQKEECDDNNFQSEDGCHNGKFDCPLNCQVCVNGQCLQCQFSSGYGFTNHYQNKCQSICGDQILTEDEECDDGNHNPNDRCSECKFKCKPFCLNCQSGYCLQCYAGYYLQNDQCLEILNDGITVFQEECDDKNLIFEDGCHFGRYDCPKNCEVCVYGQCLQCKISSGYGYLDDYQNKCKSICGDRIVTADEECDDGNNIQYDGCYLCKFQCQQFCINCYQGGCQQCNVGYYLSDGICRVKNNDGLVVFQEECDDNNLISSDGCHFGRYDCPLYCKVCVYGKCLKCNISSGYGYLDDYQNKCKSICGDRIVTADEECDDGNYLPFDGCYQCKYQCQQFCIKCFKGYCQECYDGYYLSNGFCKEIYNDGLIVQKEECDDNNLISQDGCHFGRYDCPQNCQVCVKGLCLKCKILTGYGYLDHYQNQCKSICGDHIQTIDEECDDGNKDAHDGCYECKFQCDYDCTLCNQGVCLTCKQGFYLNKKQNKCTSYCGDGIVTRFEQCDDANKIVSDGCADCKYQCNEKCLNCVEGKCYQCFSIGWELNQISNDCQPFCGDGLIVGNEQCDDQNEIQEDGCYECFYECQKVCTSCVHGYCEECNTLGWELVYNRCEPICGDKLLVGLEECDDGNDISEDGCYECKFQCQDQCTDCQKGVCMACDTKGWEIIDNICYTKCGDGYVVEGIEQCDDGNDTQYDGCFNCNYQCQELCTQCEKGICYECNVFGWIIEKNVCLPFCGDGIIVGYEQCDDMNDDFNDGCHQCVKVCDQYCLDCQQGVCLECELGRFVDQNLCHAQCGDSFYVKSVEECDDGNQDNGDGCNFNCKIEKDWSCNNIEGSFSTCYFSIKPDFTLNLITKDPEDFEVVQLTFNQKIKLSQQVYNNLDSYFKSSIESIDTSEYEIIISYSEQLSSEEIKDLVIDIRINFFVPTTSPILKVKFIDDPIVSEYNLNLAKKENSLQLLTPMVLSQSQKEVAQSAQAFNQAVIYSLVGVSSLCLMSGSSDIFWNLMDQLQYLSYIKYINIKFPNNLNMYFDVFKLITISPAMKFFGIDTIFEALDGGTQYFLETKNKFQQDEINAYFFLNFQSFLFCIFSAYLGYWTTKYGHQFFYKFRAFHFSKLPQFIAKSIFSLRKSLKQKSDQFYLNGILRILLSNTYDVTFACAIQISTYPTQNDVILKLNYIASIIVYVCQFGGTLYIINILNSFSKTNSLKNKSKYEALFDGLKSTNDQWKIQHNAIQMIKKQIFISLIVFMQEHGQIQSLCLGFVQTTFLIYLFLAQPLTNKFEYYKILVTEMLIIFNSITFIFYANRVEMQFTLENMISLGWLHVMTSTSILGVSLILDIYQQFKILIEKIQKSIFPPKIERNDSIQLFI